MCCSVFIQDLDESTALPGSCARSQQPAPQRLETRARILELIAHTPASAKLAQDVRRAKRALLRDRAAAAGPAALAERLAAAGHACRVRAAAGGPARGAACFKSLRHVFLVVTPPHAPEGSATAAAAAAARGGRDDDHEREELIVDAFCFKEHFLIPHPTPAYADLLALLPDEWAGPPSRLAPLVQLLSAEMAASFEARGLALPPWRRAGALASKWMVRGGAGAAPGSDAGSSDGEAAAPRSAGGAACGAGAAGGAAAFSRLDDGELLRAALARRGAGCRGLLSGKLLAGAGAAAGGAPGGGAGAAKAPAAAGAVSRQPPVCSGQPATWRVRVAGHLEQPPCQLVRQ